MRTRFVATTLVAALLGALLVAFPTTTATAAPAKVSALELLKGLTVTKPSSSAAFKLSKFPTGSTAKAKAKSTKGAKAQLVTAKEAWVSGAKTWTAATRKAFANDTAYAPTLASISAADARTRGAKDPAGWLPKGAKAKCAYAANWVAVKWRWRLSVDAAESKALTKTLTGCTKKSSTSKAIKVDKPKRATVVTVARSKHKDIEAAVLAQINAARAKNGVKALKSNSKVVKVARTWSAKQADKGKMSHNPKFGKQLPKGWTRAGENVAYTTHSGSAKALATRVVNMWLDSPGHRANILDKRFTKTGIGVAYSTKHGWYFTQNFSN